MPLMGIVTGDGSDGRTQSRVPYSRSSDSRTTAKSINFWRLKQSSHSLFYHAPQPLSIFA